MKIKQKNKGITLIALIITIILMLILASVSISMIVNDEIFNYAGQAVEETKNAINNEQELVNSAINDYIKPNLGITGHDGETFSKIYTKTENYTDTEGNTAVIPKGFAVGTSDGINKISTGLVIRDSEGNEFVWIPVKEDLVNPYNTSSYSEPTELKDTWSYSSLETKPKYDSQEILTELYGDKFVYARDFKYTEEYKNMVAQVNKYNGFYIGRYETTIDGKGKIGSKYNTKVLTAGDKFTYKNTEYYYRWYGLYYVQKNANVTGNKTDVQTAMIYGQLWDKTMDFIRKQKIAGKTTYDVDSVTKEWHNESGVVESGQANAGDIALNICDLESNCWEITQEAESTYGRPTRGGYYSYDPADSASSHNSLSLCYPVSTYSWMASRLVLYIK